MILPIDPSYFKRPDAGEWQTDEQGRRYRKIGKSIEYEMMIRIDGIEIPQSQLTAYHERKRELEKAKKDAEKDKPAPPPRKGCPFAASLQTDCVHDKCALYAKGCILAQVGDMIPTATEGKACPFNTYHICRTDCALFKNGGCALTTINRK